MNRMDAATSADIPHDMIRPLQGILAQVASSTEPLFAALAKIECTVPLAEGKEPSADAAEQVTPDQNEPGPSKTETPTEDKIVSKLKRRLRRQKPEEALVKISEAGEDIGVSEEEMMAVALKLQKKYKKAQKDMCGNCKHQGITKIHTTVKMGGKAKEYKMQMYLFDLVSLAREGIPAVPSRHLN